MDLLLNQKSQGPHKKFKKNLVEAAPLGSKKKQKTGSHLLFFLRIYVILEQKQTTIAEDRESRAKLAKSSSDTFGDEELPVLEKVQFKVSNTCTIFLIMLVEWKIQRNSWYSSSRKVWLSCHI